MNCGAAAISGWQTGVPAPRKPPVRRREWRCCSTASFRREIGFGLKRYARLARFERALRAVRAEDAPSLSLIAAQFGFADQPHLTREFRSFAGYAPGRLHRVTGPTPWHVVHDETFKTGSPDPRTLPS
jgi:hypothetical protein